MKDGCSSRSFSGRPGAEAVGPEERPLHHLVSPPFLRWKTYMLCCHPVSESPVAAPDGLNPDVSAEAGVEHESFVGPTGSPGRGDTSCRRV